MHTWEQILISPNISIREAIEIIDKGTQRLAIVVDEKRKLLGSVTDGDVRRGLIRHISLNNPVQEIMNSSPKYCSATDSKEKILRIMKEFDLLQIPILENGIVVGLETFQHLLAIKKRDNPVFLMAGGFGKRLDPLTKFCPKPMLKIGGKPILETIIESFISAGFHQFYISTHYMSDMIHDYFGDGSKWNVSFQYIYEETPLGTAGAISLLPDNLSDLPMIMMNGDILTKINAEALLIFHEVGKATVTTCVRNYEVPVPFGVIQSEAGRVTHIVEKPTYKHFVNAGIYVLDSKARKLIEKNKHIDMPTFIQMLISKNEKILMFPIYEYWLDVGRLEDFNQAQQDYILDFAE